MCKYTLFVFVHTLNKILHDYELKINGCKDGPKCPRPRCPTSNKKYICLYENMLSFLTFFAYSAKSYIEIKHTNYTFVFHCMPQIKHFYNWAEESRAEESQ